jgi:hypothetical protein
MNNNLRILLGTVVGIVVLTAPLFVIPRSNTLVIAYIFALLGLLALAGSLYRASNRSGGEYVTTAAFPLAAGQYFAVTLLLSLAVLVLKLTGSFEFHDGLFFLLQLVAAGFFAWKLLAMDAGREEIERVGAEVKESVFDWKLLRRQMDRISAAASPDTKKHVDSVRDAVRYAAPVSSAALKDIEDGIRNNICQLESAVEKNDSEEVESLTQTLLQQIRRRSEMSKILR